MIECLDFIPAEAVWIPWIILVVNEDLVITIEPFQAKFRADPEILGKSSMMAYTGDPVRLVWSPDCAGNERNWLNPAQACPARPRFRPRVYRCDRYNRPDFIAAQAAWIEEVVQDVSHQTGAGIETIQPAVQGGDPTSPL